MTNGGVEDYGDWAEVLLDRPAALPEVGFVGPRQSTRPPEVTKRAGILSILKL